MIDAAIVVAYLGIMLVVGWASRRQSAESYWVADRRYGTRPIAVSLIATVFGASSTLGIVGLGYMRGLTGAWWSLIGAVALLVFALVLAARVRSLEVFTLPDILQRAYGHRVSVPAAIMIVMAWCGIVSAQMIAGARLLGEVLPLGFAAGLAVTATVFVAYTFLGGQLSVIRTDSWQLALFLGGLLLCFVVTSSVVGDSGTSLGGAAPRGHFLFPTSDQFGWYDLLVFYPLIVGLPYLVGPDIYSRVLCAKDDVTARKSALVAALAVVPISFLLAALGILVRAQFPDLDPDAALPTAVREYAPIGITGLILAGFLAAVMSSADTTLVSAATILSLNVVDVRKTMTQARQLQVTRIAVLAIGLVALLIAWFQEGIIPSLILAYTVFVGGVVFPTLASFCQERLRVTGTGAMWAVIVGGSAALLGAIQSGRFMVALIGPTGDATLSRFLGPRYGSILPIFLSVVVMLTVSQIQRSNPRSKGQNSTDRTV